MKTIQLEQPGRLALVETPPPGAPGPGEALVRVRRVGICGTDRHAFRGQQPFFTYPRILGHELGVEVVEVNEPMSHLRPGDRCAVQPYLNCGQCVTCRQGKTNCCAKMRVLGVHLDGGLREGLLVPADKLHRSEDLSFDQLALVETLCIGAHAVHRAQVAAGETVLVIGAGPIGLAVIESARAAGAQVVVLDVSESRLEFCRGQLGLQHVFPADAQAMEKVRGLTRGDLPTVVFDATGNAKSMAASFHYPAQGGRLVFVGLTQETFLFEDVNFHRRELTVLASRNATRADFARVMALLEAGQVDPTPWITHRTTPEGLVAVWPIWNEPQAGVVKAVVEW